MCAMAWQQFGSFTITEPLNQMKATKGGYDKLREEESTVVKSDQ